MPKVEGHGVGTFCWADCGTTDQAGATKFYGEVFGWEANEDPLPGGDATYTTFTIGGKRAAAAYTLGPHEQGAPPHWNVYVSVDDAEQYAKRAEAAGGTIVAPAMDVMEYGRMAVIQDPTGAFLGMWQPKTHNGSQVADEHGTLSWNELMTTDVATARGFYEDLFGWKAESYPSTAPGGEYYVFSKGAEQAGGLMTMPDEMKAMGVPPMWGLYFNVDDADATAEKVKSAGGAVMNPPQDIPEVGRFAVVADPQGAVFSILKGIPA